MIKLTIRDIDLPGQIPARFGPISKLSPKLSFQTLKAIKALPDWGMARVPDELFAFAPSFLLMLES